MGEHQEHGKKDKFWTNIRNKL